MYCTIRQERERMYYEQIQQQEEAARIEEQNKLAAEKAEKQRREAAEKQRVEAEKQQVEAEKFGITLDILTTYKALMVSLGEYQQQLRYNQLQTMITKAADERNNQLVKTLLDERKLITLPSTTYTRESILRDTDILYNSCVTYYNQSCHQDSFSLDVADRCVLTIDILSNLQQQLKSRYDADSEIDAINTFLLKVQQSYKPLNHLPSSTVFSKADSKVETDDNYGVKEETAETLGLPGDLTSQYIALLDLLEVYRDQDSVIELNKQIEAAISSRNNALQIQLKTKKSKLKIGSKLLSLKEVQRNLKTLLESISKYYKDQALREDTSFDVATAERCTRTITYLEEVQSSTTTSDALAGILRKRFIKSVAGDFDLPAGVVALEWADIKVKGSSPEEVIIGEGSFGTVIKAEIRLKLGWKEAAIKVFNQKFDKEYVDVCNSALKEA